MARQSSCGHQTTVIITGDLHNTTSACFLICMIVTKQERTFLSCRIIQDSSSVSSPLSYLACVLPVHGVDGGARVHVHQVVVVVAGHHAPAPAHPLVELHGGGVDGSARHCGVRAVAPPASYLDTFLPRGAEH